VRIVTLFIFSQARGTTMESPNTLLKQYQQQECTGKAEFETGEKQ
jgi:hypothetical protein